MIANQIIQGNHSTYELVGRLGSGGMAIVYRAIDSNTKQVVAIKQVYDWLGDNPEAISRFHREVQVITGLSHPSIVPIIDSGEHESLPFMVMPFYERGNLASYFSSKTKTTVGESLIFLSQIASSLDYAHRKGIIHRDLKLENCLIDDNNNVLLADFGMAHIADATRLTFTGDLRGTPLVMAPEQGRGDKQISKGVDIYALSVIAYLLLTGYYPFTSNETLALINMHVAHRAPLPSEVNPNLPPAIDDVLMMGLSKFSDDRYDNGMTMVGALDSALHEHAMLPVEIQMNFDNPLPSIVATIAFDQPSISRVNAPIQKNLPTSTPRNRRSIWMAIATVLLIAIGGGFIALGSSLQPDNNPAFAIVVDLTETVTPSPTLTNTATEQPTATATETLLPTETHTLTATSTPSDTPSPTITASPTLSPTVTSSPTITSTATNTLTPTITSTPLPGFPGSVSGTQGANIRSGAHSAYSIVTFLEEGETMRLIGRNYQASWLETWLEDDREGWVFSRLIDFGDVDILDLPITWIEPTATLTPTPTFTPQPVFIPHNNGGDGSSNGGGNGSSNNGGNGGGGGGNEDGGTEEGNEEGGGGLLGGIGGIIDDILP